MQPTEVLVYLDHNVLDAMLKGDPHGMVKIIKQANFTPVYSGETLVEIQRSVGYEHDFLKLLEDISARYLVPILDERFVHTGRAEVRVISPHEAYRNRLENVSPLPELGFGFLGMLQKFYGGRNEQSFQEIFLGGIDELEASFMELEKLLEEVPGISAQEIKEMKEIIATIPERMREQDAEFYSLLDAEIGVSGGRLEREVGLGPKVLKNIKGPDIVRKVWKKVEAKLAGGKVDMEVFFGIKPFPFEENTGREKTMLEKVNAIYHQLNFLGYYRDSDMKRTRRFRASFSDMTHAGLASFCHLLICQDESLVMKAAAAYEYLGVDTKIVYLKPRDAELA